MAQTETDLMDSTGDYRMSVQFFRNDETVYMFDPETYQIHLRQGGSWVESNDLQLRENIRFRSIELSRKEALQLSGAESL